MTLQQVSKTKEGLWSPLTWRGVPQVRGICATGTLAEDTSADAAACWELTTRPPAGLTVNASNSQQHVSNSQQPHVSIRSGMCVATDTSAAAMLSAWSSQQRCWGVSTSHAARAPERNHPKWEDHLQA
jgi:hypothetical protein